MPRPKPAYPAHWAPVSQYVRFTRALGRCECTGECGLHRTHPGPRRCIERHGFLAQWARGLVVLTAAHQCTCDPLCADPTHLRAMCQRCHLRYDQVLHQRHAAETRRQQLQEHGQRHLWDEEAS